MFNSSLFRNKDSSLTGGLTSGKIMDPRLAEGRGRPIWTVDDRESRVTPIDLQVRCALNAWNEGLITFIINLHFPECSGPGIFKSQQHGLLDRRYLHSRLRRSPQAEGGQPPPSQDLQTPRAHWCRARYYSGHRHYCLHRWVMKTLPRSLHRCPFHPTYFRELFGDALVFRGGNSGRGCDARSLQ